MRRPALMGIVNVTPDSFSGDGKLHDEAAQYALKRVNDGADIIDFGAESTRPGAHVLTAMEEWARLGPVLEQVIAKDIRSRARISIDTHHAQTASRALDLGIDMVNDVSGLNDTAMMDILSEYDCDIVVMHALSVPADPDVTLPEDCDVVAHILEWKMAVTQKAAERGVAKERLVYDPGIGFGKTSVQSLALMGAAATFKASGGRWLYGHSRKSFMKHAGAVDMSARDAMTLKFSEQLAEAGVDYLRVHDVAAHAAMFEALMHVNPAIDVLLQGLNNPALPSVDLSLVRVKELLKELGNPETRTPPVIHIAGTNGKGSTLAFLRATYEAAGYRVHAYTSPHLVRFNERIVIAGHAISDDGLMDVLTRVTQAARHAATYFEATTAAAFLAFAEHSADVLLLETGLGGRLDATNVVEKPIATVITSIDYDHMEFLGNSLASIATEKAGIMKRNVPCFVGAQKPEAREVLKRAAREKDCPIHLYERDWSFDPTPNGLRVLAGTQSWKLPKPALQGAHQNHNAALASVVARSLPQLPVMDAALAEGISTAEWPARLQQLKYGPLVDAWGERGVVVLDGGHNASAATALREWLEVQTPPVTLLFGMMRRKDAAGFLGLLKDKLAGVITTAIPGNESYSSAELAEIARSIGIAEVSTCDSLETGMEFPVASEGNLLIAGSLFLAGEVLKNHG